VVPEVDGIHRSVEGTGEALRKRRPISLRASADSWTVSISAETGETPATYRKPWTITSGLDDVLPEGGG
jgi:hypothetical protein